MTSQSWEMLAPGWERWRDHLDRAYRPVRDWLLDALDLHSDHTLLELAAGTGSAGIDAVMAVDGRPRLVATDLAVSMVSVARRRARAVALPRATFAVMDATRIGLATGSVDRVLCESGFMLMPDPGAALQQARRVLRPGGRLAFSVWGPPEDNPWDVVADDLLVELGHLPRPARDVPGGRMADEDHTRALVHAAGFVDIQVQAVPVRFAWADLDEWERWSLATNTTAEAIGAMSGRVRATFLGRLASAFAPYRRGVGYEVPGVALCVSALSPLALEERQ